MKLSGATILVLMSVILTVASMPAGEPDEAGERSGGSASPAAEETRAATGEVQVEESRQRKFMCCNGGPAYSYCC